MNVKRKGEYIGALDALLVHIAIIALLILISFAVPRPDKEAGGAPVIMGDVDTAYGSYDPSTMMDVEIVPEEVPAPQPVPEVEAEQEMITQTGEETVAIKPKAEPRKEKPKVEKKPEKTAGEKAAEAKKLAEERVERERKAATEAASKRVAGAFSKGSQMEGSKGSAISGKGVEGGKDGNLSTGAKSGAGECGTFNLDGHSVREGGLLHPAYNAQEEGRVVVSTIANPAGHTITTSINQLANTVNSILHKAAEDVTRKTRFSAINGVNNQTGTITYYFNLKQLILRVSCFWKGGL